MNIVDIGIIFIIIITGYLGFKRGSFKSIITLLCIGIVTVVSYEFKDSLAIPLMRLLPFVKFKGDYAGITSLNVIFYRGVAFLIIFALLMLVIGILLKVSGLLDLLVKATIVLEGPSKMIGLALGIIEGIIISFVISFVIVQLPINDNPARNSRIAPVILSKTPFMNKLFKDEYDLNEKLYRYIEDKIETKDSEEINKKILESLEKHGDINQNDINGLAKKGKNFVDKITEQVKGEFRK